MSQQYEWLKHILVGWAVLSLIPPPGIEFINVAILQYINISLMEAWIIQYVLAILVLVFFAPNTIKKLLTKLGWL